MTNLLEYAEEIIKRFPSLKSEIDGLLDLCVMEIEEGGSEQHEIELCWSDISQLVKEEEAKILSRNI